jgi:hypothetical protein
VAGTSVTEASAGVSSAVIDPSLALDLEAVAYGIGLPGISDINTALAGNSNVMSNFDVGGTSDILGMVVLGGAYSDDFFGASYTYSSFVDWDLDMSLLGSQQDMLIGFLDPMFSENGFDSMNFRIEMEGSLVENQTFTDLSEALSYFDDNTLNLGDWTTGLSGNLDMKFMMDLTTNDDGAGFAFDLVLGNSTEGSGSTQPVPEPTTIALLGIGLAGLAGAEVRRRRTKRAVGKS